MGIEGVSIYPIRRLKTAITKYMQKASQIDGFIIDKRLFGFEQAFKLIKSPK